MAVITHLEVDEDAVFPRVPSIWKGLAESVGTHTIVLFYDRYQDRQRLASCIESQGSFGSLEASLLCMSPANVKNKDNEKTRPKLPNSGIHSISLFSTPSRQWVFWLFYCSLAPPPKRVSMRRVRRGKINFERFSFLSSCEGGLREENAVVFFS